MRYDSIFFRMNSFLLTGVILFPFIASCKQISVENESDAASIISTLGKADDAIPALTRSKIAQLVQRIGTSVGRSSHMLTPAQMRANLSKEILTFMVEEGGIKMADLRQVLTGLVSGDGPSGINLSRVLGYDKNQVELPLVELADGVAQAIRSQGFREPLKTFYKSLEVEEVHFSESSVEAAVRSELAERFPYIAWETRPLRKLSIHQLTSLRLLDINENASLRDLRYLTHLKAIQLEVHGRPLIEKLVDQIPSLKKLDRIFIGTRAGRQRTNLEDLASLGKIPQIKTIGLNTGFWSLYPGTPQSGNVWTQLPTLFPNVDTIALWDSWAMGAAMSREPARINDNLRLAMAAINSMPRVHTLELHSSVLGRQLASLPPNMKFTTVRLRNRSGLGRNPLETAIDLAELSRSFGNAKSLTLFNFGIKDSGRFSSTNLFDKDRRRAGTAWEEIVLLQCFAKDHNAGNPYSVKVWAKQEPALTRIVIKDSPSLKVDNESQMVLRMRRPENIVQAVLDKRNQDIIDQSTEAKVLKGFIEEN